MKKTDLTWIIDVLEGDGHKLINELRRENLDMFLYTYGAAAACCAFRARSKWVGDVDTEETVDRLKQDLVEMILRIKDPLLLKIINGSVRTSMAIMEDLKEEARLKRGKVRHLQKNHSPDKEPDLADLDRGETGGAADETDSDLS